MSNRKSVYLSPLLEQGLFIRLLGVPSILIYRCTIDDHVKLLEQEFWKSYILVSNTPPPIAIPKTLHVNCYMCWIFLEKIRWKIRLVITTLSVINLLIKLKLEQLFLVIKQHSQFQLIHQTIMNKSMENEVGTECLTDSDTDCPPPSPRFYQFATN